MFTRLETDQERKRQKLSEMIDGFYPHLENPNRFRADFELSGTYVRVVTGNLAMDLLPATARRNDRRPASGTLLVGLAVDKNNKVIEWVTIPPKTGISEESNNIDWEVRHQTALALLKPRSETDK